MMSSSDNIQLKLDIKNIGLLNDSAFADSSIKLPASAYTICFWFYLSELSATKIIANFGNQILGQKGWTVFLQGSSLNFRTNLDAKQSTLLTTNLESVIGWQHFTGIINSQTKQVSAFLNASQTGWSQQTPIELVELGSVEETEKLTIGGYTDTAGGHFNYRFGEAASELVDDFRLYTKELSTLDIQSLIPKNQTPITTAFNAVQDSASPVVFFEATDLSGSKQDADLIYVWDFGDGSSAQGQQAEHSYAYAANFDVTLQAFNRHHQHTTLKKTFSFKAKTKLPDKLPVFINGTEGYTCFRIPAIISATNGDLIAFAEGRVQGCSDATQIIHIVCKRSTDNGVTWLPLQVVARNIISDEEFACMNPAPVVDTVFGTGKIVLVFSKMETSEWAITQGDGVARAFCISSMDHGATWRDKQDITLQVHKPYNPAYTAIYSSAALEENKDADWRKQVPTLGHAIQLHGTTENSSTKGRLFFIGCFTQGDVSVFYTQNYAFWSDDLGESWEIGDVIQLREDGSSAKGLNEATAVELDDGSLMINSRNYQNGKGVGCRAVTVGTFDQEGKLTFGKVQHDTMLPDSGVQASLIHYKADTYIFANPNHPKARKKLTLYFSTDGSTTWPIQKLIDAGPSAYSDLAILSDSTIAILYEQGNHGGIVFTKINSEEVETILANNF